MFYKKKKHNKRTRVPLKLWFLLYKFYKKGLVAKMEYMIIIVLILFTILILKIGLNIKIKDIIKVKELGYDEKTNKIIKNFPDNFTICKDILEILDNKDVKIEEAQNEESTTSLYMVMQNKILIGNVKESFTRIQTIAHECIHSIQNKTLLKFNFIISNINILYFFIMCVLALFNVVNKEVGNILLIGLILMQFIFFAVRSFLEVDAMTRAELLAKEYIKKTKLLSEINEKTIENECKKINDIGIKLYVFMLAMQCLARIIVYCILLIL